MNDNPNAQRRKLNKLRAGEADVIDEMYRALMGDPKGRIFIWHLLALGRVGTQPFSPDPLSTAFTCGELNVGQQVLERVLANASANYIVMLEERNNAGRTSADARRDDDSGPDDNVGVYDE